MENLAPTLNLILEIQAAHSVGASTRAAIETFCTKECDLSVRLKNWLNDFESTGTWNTFPSKTRYESAVTFLIQNSFDGISIAVELDEIRKEAIEESFAQVGSFAETLPYKVLVPIALFIFPALLLLILGPVLAKILEGE